MALNPLSPLVIFSLVVASSLFSSSAAFGGRKALAPVPAPDPDPDFDVAPPPVNPADLPFTLWNSKDPKVLELAKFALEEYNKSNKTDLVLYSVMEAISNDKDGGIDYEIVVATVKDKILTSYQFNLFVSNSVKKLTSFEQI